MSITENVVSASELPHVDKPPERDVVAVEMAGVNKWYGDFHVLREINLRVMRGERIVICGPSGPGWSLIATVLK